MSKQTLHKESRKFACIHKPPAVTKCTDDHLRERAIAI